MLRTRQVSIIIACTLVFQSVADDPISPDTQLLRESGIVIAPIPRIGDRSTVKGGATIEFPCATDDDLGLCANVSNITSLGLDGCTSITQAGFRHLRNMPSLMWLSVERTGFGNESLKYVRELTELRGLYLSDTAIDDDGLAQLSQLRRLTELGLNSTKIQGGGLVHLRSLPNLRALSASDVALADDSLRYLVGLPLEELHIECTNITDDGAKIISTLKHLRILNISQCAIGDVGLKEIAGLEFLVTLDLSGTAVTKSGIQHFAAHKNLVNLMLTGTCIDDSVIDTLNRMPNLSMLSLANTNVSENGIDRLNLPSLSCLRTTCVLSPRVVNSLMTRTQNCRIIEVPTVRGARINR